MRQTQQKGQLFRLLYDAGLFPKLPHRACKRFFAFYNGAAGHLPFQRENPLFRVALRAQNLALLCNGENLHHTVVRTLRYGLFAPFIAV